MKIKIIKESQCKPYAWYNEVKPSKKSNGEITSGVPNKVGQIFEVSELNEKEYITKESVFGPVKGHIDKSDCIVLD